MTGQQALILADSIVDAVLKDLFGRSGFDNAWDECDQDIQDEIKDDLVVLVAGVLASET